MTRDADKEGVPPAFALRFIPTVVGAAMVWTGIWLAGPPALAAVITVGTLVLLVGSVAAGLRRRRAAEGGPIDPEEAWATYRTMRVGAIYTALVTPFIGAVILIYVEPTLARTLLAGGVAVLWVSGIINERHLLATLRDRAQEASSSHGAADAT